jgi:hypothetical protein
LKVRSRRSPSETEENNETSTYTASTTPHNTDMNFTAITDKSQYMTRREITNRAKAFHHHPSPQDEQQYSQSVQLYTPT